MFTSPVELSWGCLRLARLAPTASFQVKEIPKAKGISEKFWELNCLKFWDFNLLLNYELTITINYKYFGCTFLNKLDHKSSITN